MIAADEAFHGTIIAAARNPFLQRMYDVFIAELTTFRRNTLALPWAVARSAKGHAAIVAALRARDPAAARRAMIDHLWVLYDEVHASATAGGDSLDDHRLLPRDALDLDPDHAPSRTSSRPPGRVARISSPRSHVPRTTPASVRPAYGVIGWRWCSFAGSTTNSSSGARTAKSAS